MDRSSATECWVGLVFISTGCANVGQPGDVDVHGVFPPQIAAQLAQGFQEWQAFNIANRSANFNQSQFLHRWFWPPIPIRRLISLVICGITWMVPPR